MQRFRSLAAGNEIVAGVGMEARDRQGLLHLDHGGREVRVLYSLEGVLPGAKDNELPEFEFIRF